MFCFQEPKKPFGIIRTMKTNETTELNDLFEETEETDDAHDYKTIIKFVSIIVVAGIIALFGFQLYNNVDTNIKEKAIISEGAGVVESWMDGFEDVGNNTIVIGERNVADDSSSSYALHELRNSLGTVKETSPKGETLNLDGFNVELNKGKKFKFVDAETGEIVYSSEDAK